MKFLLQLIRKIKILFQFSFDQNETKKNRIPAFIHDRKMQIKYHKKIINGSLE